MGNVLCVPNPQPRSEESAPRRKKGVRHWIRKRVGRKRPQPAASQAPVRKEPEVAELTLRPEQSNIVPANVPGALVLASPRSIASPRPTRTPSPFASVSEELPVTSTQVIACSSATVETGTRLDAYTTRIFLAEKRSVAYVDSSSCPTTLNLATTTVVREEIATPAYVTVSCTTYTQVQSMSNLCPARCSITCTTEASQVAYLVSLPNQGSLSYPSTYCSQAITPSSSKLDVISKMTTPRTPSIESLVIQYSERVTPEIVTTEIDTSIPQAIQPKMETVAISKSKMNTVITTITMPSMITLLDSPFSKTAMPSVLALPETSSGHDVQNTNILQEATSGCNIAFPHVVTSPYGINESQISIPKIVTLLEAANMGELSISKTPKMPKLEARIDLPIPKVAITKMVTQPCVTTRSDAPALDVSMSNIVPLSVAGTGTSLPPLKKGMRKMGARVVTRTRSDDSQHMRSVQKMVTQKFDFSKQVPMPYEAAHHESHLSNVVLPFMVNSSLTMPEIEFGNKNGDTNTSRLKMKSLPNVRDVTVPNVDVQEKVLLPYGISRIDIPVSKATMPSEVSLVDVSVHAPAQNATMTKVANIPKVTMGSEIVVQKDIMQNMLVLPDVIAPKDEVLVKKITRPVKVTKPSVTIGHYDPVPNVTISNTYTTCDVMNEATVSVPKITVSMVPPLSNASTSQEVKMSSPKHLILPVAAKGKSFSVLDVSLTDLGLVQNEICKMDASTPMLAKTQMLTLPSVTAREEKYISPISTIVPDTSNTKRIRSPHSKLTQLTVELLNNETPSGEAVPILVSVATSMYEKSLPELVTTRIISLNVTSAVKSVTNISSIKAMVTLPATTTTCNILLSQRTLSRIASVTDSYSTHDTIPNLVAVAEVQSGVGHMLSRMSASNVDRDAVVSSGIVLTLPQLTLTNTVSLKSSYVGMEPTLPITRMSERATTAGIISGGRPPSPKVRMKDNDTIEINVDASVFKTKLKGSKSVLEGTTTIHVTSTPTTISLCNVVSSVDSRNTSIVDSITSVKVCATSDVDKTPKHAKSYQRNDMKSVDAVTMSFSETVQIPVRNGKNVPTNQSGPITKQIDVHIPVKQVNFSTTKSSKETKNKPEINSQKTKVDTSSEPRVKRSKSGKKRRKDKHRDKFKITDRESVYVDHTLKDELENEKKVDIIEEQPSKSVPKDADSCAMYSVSSSSSMCSSPISLAGATDSRKPNSLDEKFKILSKANDPIVTNDYVANAGTSSRTVNRDQESKRKIKEKKELLLKLSKDSAMKKSAIEKPKELTDDQKKNRHAAIQRLQQQSFQGIGRAQSFFVIEREESESNGGKQTELQKFLPRPMRKVSDFEVPVRDYDYCDVEVVPFKKPHVDKVPDVAKQEASKKISWKQTIPQGLYKNHSWTTAPPTYELPTEPLAPRLLEMYGGDVTEMRRSWIIPQCRQIETIKLENKDFPGKWVDPAERHLYSTKINLVKPKPENNKKSNSYNKQAKKSARSNSQGNVRSKKKAKPPTNKNGLSHWSRHEDLSKSRAKTPTNRTKK